MIPPATIPRNTVMMSISGRGKFGNDRANQPAVIHPAKACPGKPTLKKPARLATAKPRAIKINGPIAREISPKLLRVPKAVLKSSSYPQIAS